MAQSESRGPRRDRADGAVLPVHEEAVRQVVSRYRKEKEWAWVQRESQNMGGWFFMEPRLRAVVGSDISYVGRDASAQPPRPARVRSFTRAEGVDRGSAPGHGGRTWCGGVAFARHTARARRRTGDRPGDEMMTSRRLRLSIRMLSRQAAGSGEK